MYVFQPLASCSCNMKILLGDLLLLSLLSSVFSSCQRDCLTCQEKLHPALDSFNMEVGLWRPRGSTPPSITLPPTVSGAGLRPLLGVIGPVQYDRTTGKPMAH